MNGITILQPLAILLFICFALYRFDCFTSDGKESLLFTKNYFNHTWTHKPSPILSPLPNIPEYICPYKNISNNDKLILMHVPKSGGTSIRFWFNG